MIRQAFWRCDQESEVYLQKQGGEPLLMSQFADNGVHCMSHIPYTDAQVWTWTMHDDGIVTIGYIPKYICSYVFLCSVPRDCPKHMDDSIEVCIIIQIEKCASQNTSLMHFTGHLETFRHLVMHPHSSPWSILCILNGRQQFDRKMVGGPMDAPKDLACTHVAQLLINQAAIVTYVLIVMQEHYVQ